MSSPFPSLARHKKDKKRKTDKLVCLPYHKHSELSHQDGYYPLLSATQRECILQIKAKLQAARITLATSPEDENLLLLRFLRSESFEINATFAKLRAHVEWQAREENTNMSDQCDIQHLLQCNPSEFFHFCPWWLQGVDRQARPLVWGGCGRLELWRMMELTSLDNILRFYVWAGIQLERRLAEQSHQYGYNVETVVLIIDATGWNIGLATKDTFSFIQSLIQIGNNHFPERLGQILVINAPSVLSLAWKVISGFLEAATRRKVQFYGLHEEWFPVLSALAEESQIPKNYGGTSDDLTVMEAIASLNNMALPNYYSTPPPPSLTKRQMEQNIRGTSSANTGGELGATMTVTTTPVSTMSLSLVKESLEKKLSLNDDPSRDTYDEDRDRDRDSGDILTRLDAQPSTPAPSSNLTIIGPKKRRPKSNSDEKRFVTLSDFGQWIADSLRLSAAKSGERRRRRRRRRSAASHSSSKGGSGSVQSEGDSGDGESDGGDDSSSCSSSSVKSRASSLSSGTNSSSVYDDEGGNVLHCRQEDNVIPVPGFVGSLDSESCDSEGLTSWLHTDTKWKFNASTQTDISSFDPRFTFKKRTECGDWTNFFTCMTWRRQKEPENEE